MKVILLLMIGLSMLHAELTRDATTGIVTDSTTGLMWQDNEVGTLINWQGAIDRCEALTLGTHSDWRLPNINELTSLVDDTRYDPAISSEFQNTISNGYWSSTTYANDTDFAWGLNFGNGGQDGYGKAGDYYVRCVRAGQ
ncbi:MAG: DUF1566 domain-containing protein [Helicobacteraceae bacterium]|nr:DUF1566 domain-containing protein [Candidatus Sulfurimonas ponti]